MKDEMLTESCYRQYESDHDGDPGDPERLLPVALSLVGLQAHAALQETCSKTQPQSHIGQILLKVHINTVDLRSIRQNYFSWNNLFIYFYFFKGASNPS